MVTAAFNLKKAMSKLESNRFDVQSVQITYYETMSEKSPTKLVKAILNIIIETFVLSCQHFA